MDSTTAPTDEMRPQPAGAARAHHVLPVGLYLKIYGALLVLTLTTVGISFADLGVMSLPAALVVALVKAALVVGFFMHLRYESRFLSVVFFSSVIFLFIFFVLTLADVRSRGDVEDAESNTALSQDRAAEAAGAATKSPAGQRGASPPVSQPWLGPNGPLAPSGASPAPALPGGGGARRP